LSYVELGVADEVSLETTALFFGILRDFLIIFILVFIAIAVFFTYRKIASIMDSVDSTLKSTREVAEAVSQRFAEPTSSGTGFMYGIGKVMAFFLKRFRSG